MKRSRSVHRGAAALVLAAACVSACISVSVDTDYDPAFDFGRLQYYGWMDFQETGDPRIDNPLLRRRVRAAVDEELASKGFRLDAADPDFRIIEHFLIERELDVQTYVDSYGYGYRYGPTTTYTRVSEHEEGTVIFDVVDAESEQLVWRGSGAARIREKLTPEERAERVRAIVEQVLADFPPGPGR